MADARIDIEIGADKAVSGAAAVQRAVDGIRGSFIDLSAKVYVAQQAFTQMWRLASSGAKFEDDLKRLNRQMGVFGSTANQMVTELQAVTNGQISAANAATMASRALAVGLDPVQIKLFTQTAEDLSGVIGGDIPQAFDQLVSAAVTGRGQVLANIGIYVDLEREARNYAVQMGLTTEQITRQDRVMLASKAIAEQSEAAHHRLTDGMQTDANRLKQIEAKWDDLWTKIGQGAKTATVDAMEAVEKFYNWLESKRSTHILLQAGGGLLGLVQRWTMEATGGMGAIGEGIKSIAAANIQPAIPQDDKVWQNVWGRAVIAHGAQPLGEFPPSGGEPRPIASAAFRWMPFEREQERKKQDIATSLDLRRMEIDSDLKLTESLFQSKAIDESDYTQAKHELALKRVDAERAALDMERDLLQDFWRDRSRIEKPWDSTEQKVEAEQAYYDKKADLDRREILLDRLRIATELANEDEAEQVRRKLQEQRGSRASESQIEAFRQQEADRQRDLQDLEAWYQAQDELGVAFYEGEDDRAKRQRELLREQLAFKLRISKEEADSLLFFNRYRDSLVSIEGADQIIARADPTLSKKAREAIADQATAKDILLAEQANNDFFAGWTRGLQKYASDRDSAFGMAADQARRAAQTMEQGFSTFFFDAMEGKFTQFKDVLKGVLDVTKQIVSQIAAQLITVGIIKPGAAALASLFTPSTSAGSGLDEGGLFVGPVTERYGGIMPVRQYARGGITNFPQMAIFGEGSQPEAYVPLPDGRTIPVTLRMSKDMPMAPQAPMAVTMAVRVDNRHEQAEVQTQQSTNEQGLPQLDIIILNTVKRGIAQGGLDQAMRRFGSQVAPVRR